MTASKKYTTDFATSKDGTKIYYRKMGTGEGLILLHGGMMYSQNFMKLAELLAKKFTVYIPDRCGRGLSGIHDKHSLLAESEDLQAILDKTGTTNAFGLSSGAIIVLQTGILKGTLRKIALYEPPILLDANPAKWMNDYKAAMSKGNLGKAFISIIKGTGDPSLLTILPAFITAPFLDMAIKAQANKTPKEDELHLKSLIAAMQYDIKTVNDSYGIIEDSKSLTAETLLLGGQKSQDYFKIILETLNSALPQARRVEFPNTGHITADNGEKPEIVAEELHRFFGRSQISK